MSSGSHVVVGTCIIRTSSFLTDLQQEELTKKIIVSLFGENVSQYVFQEIVDTDVELNESSRQKGTKQERDGFNTETNLQVEIAGLQFEFPFYFEEKKEGRYFAEDHGEGRVVYIQIINDSNVDVETYNENRDSFLSIFNTFYLNLPESAVEKFEVEQINNIPVVGENFILDIGATDIYGSLYVFYNEYTHSRIAIMLIQSSEAEYSYFEDWDKIINSVSVVSVASAYEIVEFVNIQKGNKGDKVAEIQQILIDQGYLSGNADGDFGGMTENAVKEFQASKSLSITGIVDEATYNSLLESTSEKEEEPTVGTEEATEAHVPTMGEKNALNSAKNYFTFTSFSYEGIVDQLMFEGYSEDEATYAADNCGQAWNEQAVKSAKRYLEIMSFSRTGLIEQLEFDGFTHSEAEYAAEAVGY